MVSAPQDSNPLKDQLASTRSKWVRPRLAALIAAALAVAQAARRGFDLEAILGFVFVMVLLLVLSFVAETKKRFLLESAATVLVWSCVVLFVFHGAKSVGAISELRSVIHSSSDDEWAQHGNVRGLPPGAEASVGVGPCVGAPVERGGHFTIRSTRECRRAAASQIRIEGFDDFPGPPLPAHAGTDWDIDWSAQPSSRFVEGYIVCGNTGVDADVQLRPCKANRVGTERNTGHFRIEVPSECANATEIEVVTRLPELVKVMSVSHGRLQTHDLQKLLPGACAASSSHHAALAPRPHRPENVAPAPDAAPEPQSALPPTATTREVPPTPAVVVAAAPSERPSFVVHSVYVDLTGFDDRVVSSMAGCLSKELSAAGIARAYQPETAEYVLALSDPSVLDRPRDADGRNVRSVNARVALLSRSTGQRHAMERLEGIGSAPITGDAVDEAVADLARKIVGSMPNRNF